jgi:hypothetical protein
LSASTHVSSFSVSMGHWPVCDDGAGVGVTGVGVGVAGAGVGMTGVGVGVTGVGVGVTGAGVGVTGVGVGLTGVGVGVTGAGVGVTGLGDGVPGHWKLPGTFLPHWLTSTSMAIVSDNHSVADTATCAVRIRVVYVFRSDLGVVPRVG